MECPGGLTVEDGAGRPRGGGARFLCVFRLRNGTLGPSPSPLPAEDGPLRCKQMTLLLDWLEHFEAESRQSDEAVAFSVLLGDLNFDNCSLGEERLQRGGPERPGPAHQALPSLQTKRRSRSTSSSVASATPAAWAHARSSPGLWVGAQSGRTQGGLQATLPLIPVSPRDDTEPFHTPPVSGLLSGDAAEVSRTQGSRHRLQQRGARALMTPPPSGPWSRRKGATTTWQALPTEATGLSPGRDGAWTTSHTGACPQAH